MVLFRLTGRCVVRVRLLSWALVVATFSVFTGQVSAQGPSSGGGPNPSLPRMFYYPYTYFPHNYWPAYGPKWPEQAGQPYMRPPAYMARPPYNAENWRYEERQPQRHHSGFHFWLDQF